MPDGERRGASAARPRTSNVKTQPKKQPVAGRPGAAAKPTTRDMQPASNPASKSPSQASAREAELALSSPGAEGEGGERAGNVDKIRDILFGSQMRDYDRRFARFEERLLKETADLREDVKRRFESLEGFVRAEVEALTDRLQKEQGERTESDKELTRELREGQRAWEKNAGQIEEQAAKTQRELRQQLLEEARRLGEQIEQKAKDWSATLERETTELGGRMQDRFALADMLTELGLRLRDEFEIPDRK